MFKMDKGTATPHRNIKQIQDTLYGHTYILRPDYRDALPIILCHILIGINMPKTYLYDA